MYERGAKDAHDNAVNECLIETSFIKFYVVKKIICRKTREGIPEHVTRESQLEVCRKEAWRVEHTMIEVGKFR